MITYELMSHEVHRKSLHGFILSPNPTIAGIEDLGFNMPPTPLIRKNPWNDLVFMYKEGLVRTIQRRRTRRSLGLGIEGNKIEGAFEREYGAVFVPSKTNISTIAHESGHALNEYLNPDLHVASAGRIFEAINRRAEGEELLRDFDPEKGYVYRCVDEGLADWLSYQVTNPGEDISVVKAHTATITDINDPNSLREHFAILEKTLKLFRLALEFSGSDARIAAPIFLKALFSVQYGVGYYFIANAMKKMVRTGVIVPEAYTMLAQNPPSRINQLRDPSKYVKALL